MLEEPTNMEVQDGENPKTCATTTESDPESNNTQRIHPIYVNLWKSEFEELFLYKDLLDDISERNRQIKAKLDADKSEYLHTLGDKIIRDCLESANIPLFKNTNDYYPTATVHQKEVLSQIQCLCDEIEFSIHKRR